jgi:hypothetical protein
LADFPEDGPPGGPEAGPAPAPASAPANPLGPSLHTTAILRHVEHTTSALCALVNLAEHNADVARRLAMLQYNRTQQRFEAAALSPTKRTVGERQPIQLAEALESTSQVAPASRVIGEATELTQRPIGRRRRRLAGQSSRTEHDQQGQQLVCMLLHNASSRGGAESAVIGWDGASRSNGKDCMSSQRARRKTSAAPQGTAQVTSTTQLHHGASARTEQGSWTSEGDAACVQHGSKCSGYCTNGCMDRSFSGECHLPTNIPLAPISRFLDPISSPLHSHMQGCTSSCCNYQVYHRQTAHWVSEPKEVSLAWPACDNACENDLLAPYAAQTHGVSPSPAMALLGTSSSHTRGPCL